VEDTSVQPTPEEVEAVKENAESDPPVVEDTPVADTGNVVIESNDACAEDTSANTVANGPVDSEVLTIPCYQLNGLLLPAPPT